MRDLVVSIDPAGRIVLPKEVRRELAIQPGDSLKLTVQGAAVTLIPTNQKARLVRKGKALVWSTGSRERIDQQTIDKVIQDCRDEQSAPVVNIISPRSQRT